MTSILCKYELLFKRWGLVNLESDFKEVSVSISRVNIDNYFNNCNFFLKNYLTTKNLVLIAFGSRALQVKLIYC
jgi:hypothetical protein